jgi:replicative DNA helicase
MHRNTKDLTAIMSTIGVPIDFVKTGFTDLDNLIGGFVPGELVIVAGRAKMGKSSALLDLARNISKTIPVMFLSLEMSADLILTRLLSSMALVPQSRIHSTDLSEEEKIRIDLASREMVDLKLDIQDDSCLTPGKLQGYLKQFSIRNPGKFVVIIDYIQLMRSDNRGTNRIYELQEILDAVCAELKLYPVICIAAAQLNRQADQRDNKWPRLSDLRESGAIEMNADKVMFVHRPDYYNLSDGDFTSPDTGESYFIVAANRRGRAGFAKVAFISDITSFKNIGTDDKIEIFDNDSIPF